MVYEGKEKYIFISYAHKDSRQVTAVIEALQRGGYRVWYDKGIEAGTEWPEYIAEHLEACECFIAFLSESALASHNCRQEINRACDLNKKLLVVYLEDVELTPGMRLRLSTTQAMFKNRAASDEEFYREFFKARIFADCREEQPVTVPKEKTKPPVTATESAAPEEPKQKKPKLSKAAQGLQSRVVIAEVIAVPLCAWVMWLVTAKALSFWATVGLCVLPRVLITAFNMVQVRLMQPKLTQGEIADVQGAQYAMLVFSILLTAVIGMFVVATPVNWFLKLLISLGLSVASAVAAVIVFVINLLIAPN